MHGTDISYISSLHYFSAHERFWVGGTDLIEEGSWIWATSDRSFHDDNMFTDWMSNPPNPDNNGGNEHCLEMIAGFVGQWNDNVCASAYPYLCEYL